MPDSHEQARLLALQLYENQGRAQGFQRIVGIDEAGRGPLAGPVVAATCFIPAGVYFPFIDDSKKLTPAKREALFLELTEHPRIDFGIGIIDSKKIDQINILQATILAMLQAIQMLKNLPDLLLVDGMHLPSTLIPNWKIIKGDQKSQSIAAASIIAKVTRDRIMDKIDVEWPAYHFKKNKGYGTQKHLDSLKIYGPCPYHRLSFAPIRSL